MPHRSSLSIGTAEAVASGFCERPDLRVAGDRDVDAAVTCVLTRFAYRHPLDLVRALSDYRSVVLDARRASLNGLLATCFLIENPRTCFNLSIWSDPLAISEFGTRVHRHVHVANSSFGRISRSSSGAPKLWSTKWLLKTVSNNLEWDALDLRSHLE
jgi:hypothetical protein